MHINVQMYIIHQKTLMKIKLTRIETLHGSCALINISYLFEGETLSLNLKHQFKAGLRKYIFFQLVTARCLGMPYAN